MCKAHEGTIVISPFEGLLCKMNYIKGLLCNLLKHLLTPYYSKFPSSHRKQQKLRPRCHRKRQKLRPYYSNFPSRHSSRKICSNQKPYTNKFNHQITKTNRR
ncbi:hypothetical protein Hanom_Chr08g00738711 [Helianthus anomalus]